MAAPPSSRLQTMLQTAVQSVHWTYSLFWQLCPQQGILIWADGYYNGPIKTRKTVQPMEVSAEETSLQRSQQLRELYDSLSAGETNQPARRPSAALSPEDLTETEWFYLMCVSFAFPPGLGVPGKAYAKRRHVWLTGANEADSKVFTRAILAKSARIQTVLCIPLLGGVVELGTTARVQEDVGLIQRVKSFFADVQNPQPPKPAISEQSTSNPATSSGHPPFQSPIIPDTYSTPDPVTQMDEEDIDDHDDDDEDEEEEEEEEGGGESDPESEMDRNGAPNIQAITEVVAAAEPSELVQLEMSEDIRIGSPEDGSNNLESDFHMLQVNQAGNTADPQAELYMAESARGWPHLQEPMDDDAGGSLQTPISSMIGGPPLDDQLHQEDSHYSQTVSTILHYQSSRWSDSSAAGAGAYVGYSTHSAFTNWATTSSDHHNHHYPAEGTSQWLLKYILFTVPYLHAKCRGGDELVSRIRKGTPQEELSANHVLAERRRREKLNERFIILRSLVPFVTKMDKASILGDTIEYVKQLRKKIQDLETKTRQMEIDHQRPKPAVGVTAAADKARSTTDKRKIRIVEVNGGGVKPKAVVESLPAGEAAQVEVSIIESDALVELRCPHRDGLLLDVMQVLRELGVEITTVQSSLISGTLVAELRAKVKENINGRRASIMEVKRAINHIIPLC